MRPSIQYRSLRLGMDCLESAKKHQNRKRRLGRRLQQVCLSELIALSIPIKHTNLSYKIKIFKLINSLGRERHSVYINQ